MYKFSLQAYRDDPLDLMVMTSQTDDVTAGFYHSSSGFRDLGVGNDCLTNVLFLFEIVLLKFVIC